LLLISRIMSERNPMYQHPEWDLPGTPKALIGQEPLTEGAADEAEATVATPPQPEANPERSLDVATIIRAFMTDAYPLPEDAPLRIAVGKEASLTLYPNQEAVEYQQQTTEHAIYLRAGKAGEFAVALTPVHPVGGSQEPTPAPPQGSLPDTAAGSDETLLLSAGDATAPAEDPESTSPPQTSGNG
jgi:hypothetical protein